MNDIAHETSNDDYLEDIYPLRAKLTRRSGRLTRRFTKTILVMVLVVALSAMIGTIVVERNNQNVESNPLIEMDQTFVLSSPDFYLTVESDYGTPAGEGWYVDFSTAYASLDTNIVSGGSGVQYVFVSWSGDTTGTNYAQSDPITMDANKTAIALWKTQYYLTVESDHGIASGDGWYDSGSNAYASVDTEVESGGSGVQYVFTHWGGDATGTNYASSNSILMNGPKTAVANWKTQYFLTVESDHGTTSGEGWKDAGTSAYAGLDTGVVSGGVGSRYLFTNWAGDATGSDYAQSDSILMNSPKTAVATWKTQYYLTVISPHNSPMPTSSWFDAGTHITASVTSPTFEPAGTRHICTGWIGTGSLPASGTTTSVAFTIDEPSTLTWNWKSQHYLTVRSNPSGLEPILGEGWYDESESVNLAAPYFFGFEFLYWDLDGVSQGDDIKQIAVDMNGPHNATANYEKRPSIIGGSSVSIESPLLPTWISLNIALIAAILAVVFWRERRKG